MKKVEFFISGSNDNNEPSARPVMGYIITVDGVKYGLHQIVKSCEWHVTHIETGLSVDCVIFQMFGYYNMLKLSAVKELVTPEVNKKVLDFCERFPTKTAFHKDLISAAYSAKGQAAPAETSVEESPSPVETREESTKKAPERRTIKKRTYNNFQRVLRAIVEKGYLIETAEEITRRIFDDFEKNPAGLSVWKRVDLIQPAQDQAEKGPENAPRKTAEKSARCYTVVVRLADTWADIYINGRWDFGCRLYLLQHHMAGEKEYYPDAVVRYKIERGTSNRSMCRPFIDRRNARTDGRPIIDAHRNKTPVQGRTGPHRAASGRTPADSSFCSQIEKSRPPN